MDRLYRFVLDLLLRVLPAVTLWYAQIYLPAAHDRAQEADRCLNSRYAAQATDKELLPSVVHQETLTCISICKAAILPDRCLNFKRKNPCQAYKNRVYTRVHSKQSRSISEIQ
jgi:hypothetical protein